MPTFADVDWSRIEAGNSSMSPETLRRALSDSNAVTEPPELSSELNKIADRFLAGFERKALRAYRGKEPFDKVDAILQNMFGRIESGEVAEEGEKIKSNLEEKMSSIENAQKRDERFSPWRDQSLDSPVDLTTFHEVDQPDQLGKAIQDALRFDLQNQIRTFGFEGVTIPGNAILQNRWSHLRLDVTEISSIDQQEGDHWLNPNSDEIRVNLTVISSLGHQSVGVSPQKGDFNEGEQRALGSRYSQYVPALSTETFPQRYEVLVSAYEEDFGPSAQEFVRKLFQKLKPTVKKYIEKAEQAVERYTGSSRLGEVAGWVLRKIWNFLGDFISSLVGHDPIGKWKHSFVIHNLSGNWVSTNSPLWTDSFKLFGSGAKYKLWFEAELLSR
jgi:hypothetical protein